MAILFSIIYFFCAFSFDDAHNNIQTKDIPTLNKKIIEFVDSKLKKKVGRGECWDLAAQALNYAHAKWDGEYKFGKRINHELQEVFPGDIIQFKGVKLKYSKNGIDYTEKMLHHTAIVYEVKATGVYRIAHQNTAQTKRKVGITNFNLNHLVKGEIMVYRPTL